jgi:hypothetical protein
MTVVGLVFAVLPRNADLGALLASLSMRSESR